MHEAIYCSPPFTTGVCIHIASGWERFAWYIYIYIYIYVPSQYTELYILVKAPLRVLYDKIQHEGWGWVANTARGEAECCICHKTTPRVLYFIVQHKYTVLLLICWCCVGGLNTSTQSSIAAFAFQCWLLWQNGFTKRCRKTNRPSS